MMKHITAIVLIGAAAMALVQIRSEAAQLAEPPACAEWRAEARRSAVQGYAGDLTERLARADRLRAACLGN